MSVEHLNPQSLPLPKGQYSTISIAPTDGRVVAISGQLGRSGGESAASSVQEECVQAFRNVVTACGSIGATPSDIVHLRTFLVGRSVFDAFKAARSEVYSEWFGSEAPPASTLVFVSGLADPEAVCEIDALVSVPGS